ncbi:hypothetical protein NFHSH190041_12240 [Shewanella sp. NFH-SH190041]|uniref:GNAT family N-acetyltransferase n=1 Tax=Shewanella sp. NFH-SH190041 TaxID=2950245 RepID=UPI0021C2E1DE|nr:GNAT family N-acetyltransferase [Shewanella sp. NFH-SH190041]BDM63772.1 hypothetical protein NFHSH190041_12240 [Shewanella sp. NFH-SH190041]
MNYGPQYQHAFKTLNVEWISQQWQLEAPDYHALDNPDTYILAPGGAILMVLADDKPIGCCALVKMDNSSFELAKMAVQLAYQG